MKRSWALSIAALLSLLVLVLCYVAFWATLEGALLPIYMLLFALPSSWVLLDGLSAVVSLSLKSFSHCSDDDFFIVKMEVVKHVKVTFLKFGAIIVFLFLMVFFLVAGQGGGEGESYLVWAWVIAQILLVVILDKLFPLSGK